MIDKVVMIIMFINTSFMECLLWLKAGSIVLSGRFRTGSPRPHPAHALSGLSRQVSAYKLPQSCNLGGMSMNIQRTKNSAHHFRMQSEREQTLVI